jgi:integrase
MSATWGQIDPTAGTWTKRSSHTKQAKLRHVPLNASVRQLLASIRPKDAKLGDLVFPGRKPDELLKQLRSCWAKVTEGAGITGMRVYDVRHFYASVLTSSLGHASPRETQHYSHFYTDPLLEAAERVSAVVAPESQGPEVAILQPAQGDQR